MTAALRVLGAVLRGAGEPCRRERRGGVDVLVARPSSAPRGTVVYANAATPRGLEAPAVGRLVGGLASAGFVAVAPELPDVRSGVIKRETVEVLVDIAARSGPRPALLGASTGAAVAVLAAAQLGDRVASVAAVAPFADLKEMLRLGTTGTYRGAPYAVAPLVSEMARRSLRAVAPHDPAVEPLLANRDPDVFDDLYDALGPATRAAISDLSPLSVIGAVGVTVELACAPGDPFCPLGEAQALARAGSDVRLTVTPGLDHVRPRPRPGALALLALLDRTLRRTADGPRPLLRPAVAR